MDKLLEKEFAVRVMALVIAALLWFQAGKEQNPYIEKTIDNIPIKIENVSADYTVLGGVEPATVKIKVSGLQQTVAGLTVKDFVAYVDLSGGEAGAQSLAVKTAEPAGVKVAEVTPKNVIVTLDTIVRQNYPVTIVQQGLPAVGYSIGKVFFDPAEVVIEGAKSKLMAVKSTAVVVDVNGVAASFTRAVTVNAFDADGATVKDLTVTPAQVNVTIDVVQAQTQKTIPVNPSLVGDPAEGYQIREVILEPNTVTITGPQDKVNGVTAVSTQPVDITGFTANFTGTVGLQLPEGIAVIGPTAYSLVIAIDPVVPPVEHQPE